MTGWSERSPKARLVIVAVVVAIAVATMVLLRASSEDAALDRWCGQFQALLERPADDPLEQAELEAFITSDDLAPPPDGSKIGDVYDALRRALDESDEEAIEDRTTRLDQLCGTRAYGSLY